jgi:hypothetical protein
MDVTYDFSDIDGIINEFINEIISRMVEFGEEATATAVSRGRYQNITGNLRSSIGYIVSYNGRVVREGGFKQVTGRGENMQKVDFTTKRGKSVVFWAKGRSGDGSEGSQTGMDFARAIAAEYPEGITLVVVAGMDYASIVNAKGFDVLDSAEIQVRQMIAA